MTDSQDQNDSLPSTAPQGPERVAKVIARSGLASRRDAEKMILAGLVYVNGKQISSPAFDVLPSDKVVVDGKPVDAPQETRLWLYYKPLGLVTTEKDEQGRRTIFDEMPEGMPRVLNVGRLDLNSEGLLLLTNDGGLKRRLELPDTAWLRKYRVRVNGRPTDATFDPLRRGVTVDGEDFLPMEISLDRQQGANAWLTIGLREGRNREIRRAMTEIGLTVNRLIRVSYGPFRLNEMQPGDVVEIKRKLLRDQLGDRLLTGAEDGRLPRAERMPMRGKPGGKSFGDKPFARDDRKGDDRDGKGGERKGFGRQQDFASGSGERPFRKDGDRPFRKFDGEDRGRFGAKPRAEGFRSHRDEERGERPRSFEKRPFDKAGDKAGPRGPAGGGERRFERREDGERKPYPKRDDRGGDSFERKPYEKRPFDKSGPRPERRSEGFAPRGRSDDNRGFGGKSFGGKPSGFKPRDDRGDRNGGERSEGFRPRSDKPWSDTPRGDRPYSDRPYSDKPRSDKPRSDKPWSDKPRGDRPYSGRPQSDRPQSDRPQSDRPYSDRPRSDKPRSDKPWSDKPRSDRSFGGEDRPGYKSTGFKSHGAKGKPRAEGFKSHGAGGDRPQSARGPKSEGFGNKGGFKGGFKGGSGGGFGGGFGGNRDGNRSGGNGFAPRGPKSGGPKSGGKPGPRRG